MTTEKHSSDLSLRLRLFAYTVSIGLPLTASTMQAGTVFTEAGGGITAAGGVGNAVHAGAIICSSVIIGLLTGKALVRRFHLQAILGILVWAGIVTFSTMTSTMAILNNSTTVIADQIAGSDQSRVVQASLEANLATIASLQVQIDQADPVRWRSKREAWAGQIQDLQRQNQQLLGMQRSANLRGEGSSLADTFGKLEEYGVTRTRFAALASFLLDAIPFVTALLLGSLTARRQAERAAGKKRQGRPSLHAVA